MRWGGARLHYSSRQAARRGGAGYRAASARGVMGVVVRGPCGRARLRSSGAALGDIPGALPPGPCCPRALGCIARVPPGRGGSRCGRGPPAVRPGSHVRPGPCLQRPPPHGAGPARASTAASGAAPHPARAGLLGWERLGDLAAVISVGTVEFTTRTLSPPPQSRELMGRHLLELH